MSPEQGTPTPIPRAAVMPRPVFQVQVWCSCCGGLLPVEHAYVYHTNDPRLYLCEKCQRTQQRSDAI